MNNKFEFNLSEKINYDIKILSKMLDKELLLKLNNPIKNNTLDYDGMKIKLKENKLIVETNYYYADNKGKYITFYNAKIIEIICEWSQYEMYKSRLV